MLTDLINNTIRNRTNPQCKVLNTKPSKTIMIASKIIVGYTTTMKYGNFLLPKDKKPAPLENFNESIAFE